MMLSKFHKNHFQKLAIFAILQICFITSTVENAALKKNALPLKLSESNKIVDALSKIIYEDDMNAKVDSNDDTFAFQEMHRKSEVNPSKSKCMIKMAVCILRKPEGKRSILKTQ